MAYFSLVTAITSMHHQRDSVNTFFSIKSYQNSPNVKAAAIYSDVKSAKRRISLTYLTTPLILITVSPQKRDFYNFPVILKLESHLNDFKNFFESRINAVSPTVRLWPNASRSKTAPNTVQLPTDRVLLIIIKYLINTVFITRKIVLKRKNNCSPFVNFTKMRSTVPVCKSNAVSMENREGGNEYTLAPLAHIGDVVVLFQQATSCTQARHPSILRSYSTRLYVDFYIFRFLTFYNVFLSIYVLFLHFFILLRRFYSH